MEKNKEILEKLLERIEKRPDLIEGYEKLFNYYVSDGKEAEAISILEKLLEIKKDYPEGECHLGIMYFNRGELEKAEKRFLCALKINPEMKDANFNLGFLYKICRKYKESLLFFRKVIYQDPADIETLFNVAECCVEIGKNKDAEFFYQKVLKLNPDHKGAKEGLVKIKGNKKEIKKYSKKEKLDILFVQEFPCIRNYKMARALKSKGHKVSLAYTRAKLSQVYNLNDDVYHKLIPVADFRQLWDVSRFYDIIHCHNEPDVLTVNCLAGDSPVIHDTHDLISLREPKNVNFKFFEGIANRGSDGRVYSTHLQMLEAHNMYGIELDNSIVLYNYVSKDDIPFKLKPKISKKDGEVHIVYEGGIGINIPHRNFMPIFKEIAKRGIHIHIYPAFHIEEYEREFSNNPYIHYNRPISPRDIMYEMSQYDFGIIPFIESEENSRHINSMIPHKLFEYMAAGLPVITSDIKGIKYFIEKDNIGITYKNIGDIFDSMERLKKIKVKNKIYTIEDEVDKLVEFYHKIIIKKKDSPNEIYDEKRREHLKRVYSKLDRINDFYNGINVDPLTNQLARHRIERIISMLEGDVLEVGCSGGIISILGGRNGHNCVGIDPVPELISTAKVELSDEPEEVQKRVKFEVAWAEDMPFEDNRFDTVVLGEVLEHVMDVDLTLREVERVLKPEGKVIATVPRDDTGHPAHVRAFYPESFKNIMDRYFTPIETNLNGKYFIWYIGRNNGSKKLHYN